MAERELAIVIRAKDLASRAVTNINQKLGTIGKQASRGLQNAAHNIGRGIEIAGVAAVGGLAYSVKAAGDFEARMNTLNTIARATGDAFSGELGEIGDRLRKLARDTGTPLEELTTAYYDLLSAGIKTANAQDVLVASNRLAIGGLATTAETVDLLTTAINSYGGDATKAAEYADNFAVAIERGKVTAAEIAESFAQVGALAATMGVGIDEVSALLAQMTSKGTPAAEAFTQMRAAMIALQRQTPEMKKVLDELNITNVEAEVASRGLVPVWDDLRRKADELGIPLIKLTGRVEGTLFALANTGDEFESFNAHLKAVREGTGTAQEQMDERQKGLNFQLARMRAILGDVAITLGSKLLPKIVPMLQKLAEFVEGNQKEIEKFAGDVAAGFERAVTWASKLDWGAIANSLKAAAGFGKGLVEAFLGMPSWVQAAVVTGWGLNKLTGGALGNIVGTLTAALGKAFLQTIGLMNVNATVVNVNGGVKGGVPGGLGGPVGGGAKPFLPTGAGGWAAVLGIAAVDAMLVKTAVDVANDQVRNVTVAADFQKGVVSGRSDQATVAELKALREDLQEQMAAGGGDPIADVLKGIFVNSDLEDQIEAVDRQIAAQTAAVTSGQADERQQAWQRTQSQINEFRQASNERRGEANRIAGLARQAESNDRTMIQSARRQHDAIRAARASTERVQAAVNEGRAATQRGFSSTAGIASEALGVSRSSLAQLGTIAAKNMSPMLKVTVPVTVNTNVAITELQRVIASQRTAVGNGFTAGIE